MTALLEFFKPLVSSEKAFRFAREKLREKYDPLFLPASYDHVIETCRVTHDDFVSYYTSGLTSTGLYSFLIERLRSRSEAWVFNRPHDAELEAFFSDFIAAYELYFYTHDPNLTVLYIASASREILGVVQSIQESIRRSPTTEPLEGQRQSFTVRVIEYLETSGIPCETLQADENEVHLLIADPGSAFPVQIYLLAREVVDGEAGVDACLRSLHEQEAVAQLMLVTASPPPSLLRAYAKRRGITWNTIVEFSQSFVRSTPNERYVMGDIAVELLARSYNVRDFYIEPTAVPSMVGDELDLSQIHRGQPLFSTVKQFLEDDARNVLFVFGGYGSGKSALCAHLMHSIIPAYPSLSAVYVALRQVQSSDEIERVIEKADHLARGGRRAGRNSIVILDGIDEIHNAMSQVERRKNIMAVLRGAVHAKKLITTVRTSYFRGLEEFWSLFKRDLENPLWSQMASLISTDKRRPTVTALIISDLNTDQIYAFVKSYAQHRSLPASFPETFMESMKQHDAGQYYRMLVRNPLYMFLILESKPWESDGVNCFADILELLIKFWIARDVEKGQSRWLLSASDRVDFMAFLCRKLFSSVSLSMTFAEFESAVSEFFNRARDSRGFHPLVMDLQTTGIFTAVRDKLYFLVPAFLDFFIARWFHAGDWGRSVPYPPRLPSVDQAKLWAGLVETQQSYIGDISSTDSDELKPLREPLLRGADLQRKINLPAQGALYGKYFEKPWAFLNEKDNWPQRMILNAAFDQEEEVSHGLRVLIRNWRGLHARAAAKMVTAYDNWCCPHWSLKVRREGETTFVSPASIMGLMMLGAGYGSVLIFTYEGCTLEDVEEFFRSLKMLPEGEATNFWTINFWEQEDSQRYVY